LIDNKLIDHILLHIHETKLFRSVGVLFKLKHILPKQGRRQKNFQGWVKEKTIPKNSIKPFFTLSVPCMKIQGGHGLPADVYAPM